MVQLWSWLMCKNRAINFFLSAVVKTETTRIMKLVACLMLIHCRAPMLPYSSRSLNVRLPRVPLSKGFRQCSMHSDCDLPMTCCKGLLFDYCCDHGARLERRRQRRRILPNITIPDMPPLIPPLPTPKPIPIPIPIDYHSYYLIRFGSHL